MRKTFKQTSDQLKPESMQYKRKSVKWPNNRQQLKNEDWTGVKKTNLTNKLTITTTVIEINAVRFFCKKKYTTIKVVSILVRFLSVY